MNPSCTRHGQAGDDISNACLDCGHSLLVHPGGMNSAVTSCVLCRLENIAAALTRPDDPIVEDRGEEPKGHAYTEADVTRPTGGLFDVENTRIMIGDVLERRVQRDGDVVEKVTLAALYHLLTNERYTQPSGLIMTQPRPRPRPTDNVVHTGGFDVQIQRDPDGLVWVKLPGYGLMAHEDATRLANELRDAATRVTTDE